MIFNNRYIPDHMRIDGHPFKEKPTSGDMKRYYRNEEKLLQEWQKKRKEAHNYVGIM